MMTMVWLTMALIWPWEAHSQQHRCLRGRATNDHRGLQVYMVHHPHNEVKGGGQQIWINMLQKWLCAMSGGKLPI